MFKNRLLLWTGVILIGYGLGSVDTVFADDAPMVAGHLVLDAQTPCDGIPVVLEQSANVPFRETRTDWLCQFSFSNLQSGSYYIHVAIPGYQELRQAVHISSPLDVRRLPLVLVKTSRSEGRRGDLTMTIAPGACGDTVYD